MKKLNLIIKIISFILAIALVYMVLLKLTNHSPTIDVILLVGLGVVITVLFSFNKKLNYHIGKFDSFMEQFKEFSKDFKQMKNQYNRLDIRLENIDKTIQQK